MRSPSRRKRATVPRRATDVIRSPLMTHFRERRSEKRWKAGQPVAVLSCQSTKKPTVCSYCTRRWQKPKHSGAREPNNGPFQHAPSSLLACWQGDQNVSVMAKDQIGTAGQRRACCSSILGWRCCWWLGDVPGTSDWGILLFPCRRGERAESGKIGKLKMSILKARRGTENDKNRAKPPIGSLLYYGTLV
ncbi:hypothetical protein VTO42DRAFT_5220 [Malbranchea cinnamomea]